MSEISDTFKKGLLIRRVEERLLELFRQGLLQGTTHTCIGQEMAALALSEALKPEDTLISHHRCHGHYIAKTDDLEGLIAEIMGKEIGVNRGFGGSQHLCRDGFYSNGIQGGIAPVAAGLALAHQIKNHGLTALCLGDGTFGEGAVYETLNMASLWRLPLLIFVEQNHIAQSTPTQTTTAGQIKDRALSFNIPCYTSSTSEYTSLFEKTKEAAELIRSGCGPQMVLVDTQRLEAHSKGDDFRPESQIQQAKLLDPIYQFIQENSNQSDYLELQEQIKQRIDKAVQNAEQSEFSKLSLAIKQKSSSVWKPQELEKGPQYQAIKEALKEQLETHSDLMLIGEDIESPYGGAFKVTEGLSDLFPNQVRNTPISEAAITGLANGLALKGIPAIVEIMFGDFCSLAFDQILNHAAKFKSMYGERRSHPFVLRAPMGGGRGYGPTHSQNLEKHFSGIPNLDLLVLHGRVNIRDLYNKLFHSDSNPTLIAEHKLLYSYPIDSPLPKGFHLLQNDERYPMTKISPPTHPDLTLIAIGGLSVLAESIIEELYIEEEIAIELLLPLQLSPCPNSQLFEEIQKTRKVLILEEGTSEFNLGSEIAAYCAEKSSQPIQIKRISSLPYPIPNSRELEKQILPSKEQIKTACIELYDVE